MRGSGCGSSAPDPLWPWLRAAVRRCKTSQLRAITDTVVSSALMRCRVKRRKFIALLASASAGFSLPARAQQADRIRPQPRERREVVRTHEHVHGIHLDDVHAVDETAQVSQIDASGGTRLGEALRAQGERARVGGRELSGHPDMQMQNVKYCLIGPQATRSGVRRGSIG